ncbi:unnamed protein product [Chondrus crispus]|uniref:Probable ATP-dependent transporter ycf16 n=1 Tax=Chondrus crispus TaxID=2769 RepID=R7QF92_CHOCR|nr:unnamed protein product [Chondrus crispus]CDF36759.1 unnamed protein product [Chondrus crispus]|eukprot:XP_005716578.1 unnamed protein product [Chondrus crispus]
MCAAQPFIARRFLLAIAAIVTSKLIGIAVPFLFKSVVDSLMAASASASASTSASAAAHIMASTSHEMRNAFFAKAGQRIGRSITASSFAHILSLEAAFHNTTQTGALTRIVDRGTRSVLTIFRGMLFAFLPSLFELLLVCIVLLNRFSLVYVAVTVATFLAFIAWTLAVKAFHNDGFEFARYDESLQKYEKTAIRNEWLFSYLNMGQGAIFTVGLTINLFLATNGVIAGTLTVGSVVMLATMLQQLWVPLNFLGWQYREVKQSLIDLQNLFEILQRAPKIADVTDAKPLRVAGGEIRFDNVSFHKPPKRKLALNKLSFTVPAGKSLALVGSSGSGKSTATRLLYRLYDLSGGSISIDGQDISKATLASLRQAVSIVPQDTALFNDTIAYNIRYGRPSASDEDVVAAAKAASIHDVIMRTPHNYQTLVGERGVRLSGGERQRLSVARAFLKGSKIIIEDESTSALDTLTEMEVSEALRKLGVDRTRIIVAHRLSTIMNVDHIVVMRYGKKVEEGTFSELLSIPNGTFKGMWDRQQKSDDTDTSFENGATDK